MNRFVLALPLKLKSKVVGNIQFQTLDGWPANWADEGKGLTRQLGNLGNYGFSTANVTQFKLNDNGVALFSGVTIFRAVQVSKRNTFNQLILIGEIQTGREKLIHELRSPGQERTKDKIKSVFGLEVDDTNTVFATAAFSDMKTPIPSRNGLIYSDASNPFAFDICNSLIISAVGAERMILENATKSLFSHDFLALQSRQNLNRLNNWISIPSSDSTRILEDMNLLRGSLNLNERIEQVSKALTNRTKSVDYSLATFFGGLGFTNAAVKTISGSDLVAPFSVLVPLGVSLLASAFVYSIVRRS